MIFAGHAVFNFHDPESFEYNIDWIALSLSRLNRFNGYTKYPYSVAQHSVYCALQIDNGDPELALAALLHDAAEAFVGDVTRPLKQLCPDYLNIEDRVQRAIYRYYELPERMPDAVKEVDVGMLVTEMRQLTLLPPERLSQLPEGYPLEIHEWEPLGAYARFIQHFYLLEARRD